jgi:hypothetical protein
MVNSCWKLEVGELFAIYAALQPVMFTSGFGDVEKIIILSFSNGSPV